MMSTLATFIQHSFGSLSYSYQWEKEAKGLQIGKEVKLSLFADDLILSITIPFTITSKKKKKKHLGINLPKETKDMYSKNY